MRILPTAFIVLLAMAATVCADEPQWVQSPEGQTLLCPFTNAPFPHPTRAEGFHRGDTFFPYAGHYDDSTIGIFIPAGYVPRDSVDYVVHFHGFNNHVSKVFDDYDLRHQMVLSGLNAILIVPQGPKDAADAGEGKLEHEPGGLAALLHEITDYLNTTGKLHAKLVGKVAITSHSGGYNVASAVLQRGGMDDNITDVLLFDSSYGNLEGFADWTKKGHGRRLISIFTEHLASANVELMGMLSDRQVPFTVNVEKEGLPETTVKPRGVHFLHTLDLLHDQVPSRRNYFAMFLRTSALAKD